MKNKTNLLDEIISVEEKFIFYRSRIYKLSSIKKKINNLKKIISLKEKGIVSISTRNKIKFIINFYACSDLGFPIYINNNNSVKRILKEKINVNYIFINNKLHRINKIKKKKYKYNIIIKTSGSTSLTNYVLLKNENLSFVCNNMNNEMFENKYEYNELIFAPIDHAFGFARLHSLLTSKNNFTITDQITYSNLEDLKKNVKSINSISIPAKILSNLLNMGRNFSNQILKNIKYIQVSTGYFPLNLRKKIVSLKINLFINYGMTEAMRSTFLNYEKFKNKIHTEGKPFKGVNIKILKNKNKFGKILIKGKNLAYRYNDIKIWKKKFKSNYFDSGDIGYLDKDNFLIFKSRVSNKININGIVFYLDEIENILKKKFSISIVKIVKLNKSKFYLILDKQIDKNLIYNFLKNKKINIFFEEIISFKLDKKDTGKIDMTNIIKKIYEKKKL